MAPSIPQTKSSSGRTLQSTPYEDTKVGKAPIPITVAPTPSSAQIDLHPSLRIPQSSSIVAGESMPTHRILEEVRADSGMAATDSTAKEPRTPFIAGAESTNIVKKAQSLPKISPGAPLLKKPYAQRSLLRNWSGPRAPTPNSMTKDPGPTETPFLGLVTDIPTTSFEDLTSPDSIQFSKRGSILIGGRRAAETYAKMNGQTNNKQENGGQSFETSPVMKDLSEDEEALSRRVRSMYESDKPQPSLDSREVSSSADKRNSEAAPKKNLYESTQEAESTSNRYLNVPQAGREGPRASDEQAGRGQWEFAGGIEDWEDIEGGDVDRYGFISPKYTASNNLSSSSLPTASPTRIHRVSTALQLASESPRRRTSRLGRVASVTKSARSARSAGAENASRYTRPVSSQSSYRSTSSIGTSKFRSATNKLPHNRQRRLVDEAGDMLTLPPGLADIAEYEEGGRAADTLKRKEWEREAKWRKMAKSRKDEVNGGGMVFTFDTGNPKLIERTWKGIPDKWRATAWHSFLSTSAKKHPSSRSDAELIASFHNLLHRSSPDDVQIDIDVPRTINGHVMFRKRYRGGQRLLFRVLHCLSLYFPDTGYVQGMAALAATLLCYFDEEMAFVMLVRMWQLRGLERLYKAGFEGLMQALNEFEEHWLKGGLVGSRLSEFGITSTAYGTRWYLTVFNYSIPFPAQLRVWDVFMLLGDESGSHGSTDSTSFNGQLDVLHATSAALIDATRDIILDSDFENAMKVLTSWIPIKDEDMLLEVAKAEWREYRKRTRQ